MSFFFSLVYAVTNDYRISFLSTLFHFLCGVVLILNTNAEDIMPAYGFYVGATFFLVQYFTSGRIAWLMLSALLFRINWFMHWTIAVAPFFLLIPLP